MKAAAKKKTKAKPKAISQAAPASSVPLRLEWLDPAELATNPRNWRTHPQQQVDSLRDVLAEVGWAGAALFNERTQRLIDGHCRQKLGIEQGGKIPVLVGSWSEQQEALILATLDPIAAMAEANASKLDELLRDVETGSEALAAMLDELAQENGIIAAEETSMPSLPDGDKPPFEQMTFTLHEVQARTVKQAIEAAKDAGDFDGSPNENSNGNALARIAEAYLAKC